MKFALFEFTEDSSCAVGERNWIVDENKVEILPNDEVVMSWPKPTNYTKWSNKNGAKALNESETVDNTKHAAKVLKFSDDFTDIRGSMNTYVLTGRTKTPTWGRGQRQTKRNIRYSEDNVQSAVV
ncbi:Hypothetical predicted protein, partial [Paramuricea clavata]